MTKLICTHPPPTRIALTIHDISHMRAIPPTPPELYLDLTALLGSIHTGPVVYTVEGTRNRSLAPIAFSLLYRYTSKKTKEAWIRLTLGINNQPNLAKENLVKLAINVVIGLKEDNFKATVKMPVQLGGGEINVKDIDAAFMERHGWKEEEQEEPLEGESITPGHEVGEDIPAEDEQMQEGEGVVLGQEVGEDIVAGDEQMQESDDVVPGSQIGEDITAVDDRMQE